MCLPELVSSSAVFGGSLRKYRARSLALGGTATTFNLYLPSIAPAHQSAHFPVIYYLAGLTCNEDTAPTKGCFLEEAAVQGLAMVFPDTSPRGANVLGEADDYRSGLSAGFYINATATPWSECYNMYTFVSSELPRMLASLSLPLDLTRASLMGDSMGGHGALVIYLRSALHTPVGYRGASAFCAMCNPTQSEWGQAAFKRFLQGKVEEGREWDATCLLATVGCALPKIPVKIKIDIGTEDHLLANGNLRPEAFVAARDAAGLLASDVELTLRKGYDHSFYFISTFAKEHVRWHAAILRHNFAPVETLRLIQSLV